MEGEGDRQRERDRERERERETSQNKMNIFTAEEKEHKTSCKSTRRQRQTGRVLLGPQLFLKEELWKKPSEGAAVKHRWGHSLFGTVDLTRWNHTRTTLLMKH
jgi:hypothetical protein